MDTSWIELPNTHPAYLDGFVKFIELAKENLVEGRTQCPCKKCMLRKWLLIEEVENHILFKGFYKEYKDFVFHGKGDIVGRIVGRQRSNQDYVNDPDPKRSVGYDATFGVKGIQKKRRNVFHYENDIEIKRMKDGMATFQEELAAFQEEFLLMLNALRTSGQVSTELLDGVVEQAIHAANNGQVSDALSGNDIDNETEHSSENSQPK